MTMGQRSAERRYNAAVRRHDLAAVSRSRDVARKAASMGSGVGGGAGVALEGADIFFLRETVVDICCLFFFSPELIVYYAPYRYRRR